MSNMYRLNLTVGNSVRNNTTLKGNKSVSHYDYIMREEKYSHKGDCLYTSSPNFDKLGYEPREFWEKSEDQMIVGSEYTTYKEFKLTLPKELTDEQNIELAEKFCKERFGDKYLYTLAIHNPDFHDAATAKKGEKQVHAHIMFSLKEVDHNYERTIEQFLKPYKWVHKKNGGGKVNSDMNSNKSSFLKDSRKMWENILNAKLEEQGLELVSSDTLVKQREDAIAAGDFKKAEMLDRPPIDIPKRFYWQKKKYKNDPEKEKVYDLLKEFRKDKINLYNKDRILEQLEKEAHKYQTDKKDILGDLSKIDGLSQEISKIKAKADPVKLEQSVLNNVTNGEYFKIQNQLRMSKKKKDKEKLESIKNALRELEELRSTKEFKKKYDSYAANYNKKIGKLEDLKEQAIKELEKNASYDPKKDGINSLNYLYYAHQQFGEKATNETLNNLKKNQKELGKELIAIENKILNEVSNNKLVEVENSIISLKDDLKVQQHYLKQNPGFLEKRKINKEIKEIEIKINDLEDYKKGLMKLKDTSDFKDKLSAAKKPILAKNKENKKQQAIVNNIKQVKKKPKKEKQFSVDIELNKIEELEKD